MLEFEIIARGLYRPDQVVIHYDPALCIAPTRQKRAWMDTYWQEQLLHARLNERRLFDAPLFRYIRSRPTEQTLDLTLGDTSYKEYVTTRTPLFAHEHARHELSNPLAVCSVIETSDGFILLDRRVGVDVYVGRYHVIGGFFERTLDTHAAVGLPDPFAAIRREIREETGIQSSDISEQYCLGVVYDLTNPHAELCFLTRLRITLQDVQERTPEDAEIKQLIPLQVTSQSLREFILQHHGNISATGEPNLLFYGALKFGASWLAEILPHL
ncbi:MAG: hypothetical protein NVS2B12_16140 [Ktedonobacteraceae bacterium]